MRSFFSTAAFVVIILMMGWTWWLHRKLSKNSAETARRQSSKIESPPIDVHRSKLVERDRIPNLVPVKKNQIEVLNEIFETRNDNDPRLDTAFNRLAPAEKAALRERYDSLPMEKRNERGTIVFLLGRNLTSVSDLNFFNRVIEEPVCLSLANCGQAAPPANGNDGDLQMGASITKAYPQIVAIKSVSNWLATGDPNGELGTAARKTMHLAESSKNPVVAETALKKSREVPSR